MAPPRTVDYQPETDELALLQTLEGTAEEEGQEEGPSEGDDDDAEGLEAARRKQVGRAPCSWRRCRAPTMRLAGRFLGKMGACHIFGQCLPNPATPAAAVHAHAASCLPLQEAARKTRKDRNRELRRREVEEALAEQVRCRHWLPQPAGLPAGCAASARIATPSVLPGLQQFHCRAPVSKADGFSDKTEC